jgi:homoserine O-succinyltransferase
MVMSPDRAAHQDIRPLRIGLLNLMPKKIQTENQFARLIGATPLQIDLHLIRMSNIRPRTPPPNIWRPSIAPSRR